MKKIMIAAAIVCAAAFAQASTIKWSSTGMTTTAGVVYGPSGLSMTAYAWGDRTGYSMSSVILVNSADLSQSDLLTGLRENTYTWGDKKLDSTSLSTASKIASKTTDELTSLAGTTPNVYYALFATDNEGATSVLISNTKAASVPVATGDPATIGWANDSPTFSANNYGKADFSSAGWYTVKASDVPEPTSGLLLLLGMAGLALRRRRA